MSLNYEAQEALKIGQYVPCCVLHPSLGCEFHAGLALMRSIARAVKLYIPVNILSHLIYKRKEILSNPRATFKKFILAVFRTSLFIGVFNFNARIVLCYTSRLFQGIRPISSILGSMAATMAMYIEDPKRRSDLSMYLFPRAIETLWNIAEKNFLVKSIVYGDLGLFSFSMGVMMMIYSVEPKYLKDSFVVFFKRLLGNN